MTDNQVREPDDELNARERDAAAAARAHYDVNAIANNNNISVVLSTPVDIDDDDDAFHVTMDEVAEHECPLYAELIRGQTKAAAAARTTISVEPKKRHASDVDAANGEQQQMTSTDDVESGDGSHRRVFVTSRGGSTKRKFGNGCGGVGGDKSRAIIDGTENGEMRHDATLPFLRRCRAEKRGTAAEFNAQASKRAQLVLTAVSCFTALFIVAELIGGYLAHSLAIITDSCHMISDLSSFLISILAIHMARNRAATEHFSFGFHRAEVLGALSSILAIWAITGVLLYLAILRLIQGDSSDVDANTMMITASLGVLFNMTNGALLHFGSRVSPSIGHHHSHGGGGGGGGHSHHRRNNNKKKHSEGAHSVASTATTATSHSSSSSPHAHHDKTSVMIEIEPTASAIASPHFKHSLPTAASSSAITDCGASSIGSTTESFDDAHHHHHSARAHHHRDASKNLNVGAAFIHVLGDLLQSIGVLLAAVVIKLTGWTQADPICTLLFSAIVLFTTTHVFLDTIGILMEGVPSGNSGMLGELNADLLAVAGVRGVHSLRLWALNADALACVVHLELDELHRGEEAAMTGKTAIGGGNLSSAMDVVREAHRRLTDVHHIQFVTVQICSESSYDCGAHQCLTKPLSPPSHQQQQEWQNSMDSGVSMLPSSMKSICAVNGADAVFETDKGSRHHH